MTTTISSSAVEGALLVRMRRTERELREIEGEVQRWKETLTRGTRSDSRTATELGSGGLDELPGLCAEALQGAMNLRRRAETVRRSMTYIRNTAAEQSAARMGVANNSLASATGAGGIMNNPGLTPLSQSTPGQTRSPSTSNNNNNNNNPLSLSFAAGSPGKSASTTYHSGGGSALAYFVEDFVNSEFGMQEQAWWDVMTDIEGVESLAVSLLSVPSSELSEQRIRDAASLHQSRTGEWTQENWDASISASVGLPAGMMTELGGNTTLSPSSMMSRPRYSSSNNNNNSNNAPRASPLSPSSLYSSFASVPISDLLLRRLQEQNRQKGLYGGSVSSSRGLADDHHDHINNQTSAHVGPIFASLAANPEVMSASDFDRLPKSDPLALFLSQMGGQLEEEQRRLRQLSGGISDPLRFGSFHNNNNNGSGILAGAFDSQAPSYLQVRPNGNVYSPERMGYDYLQRQREEDERARIAQEQSTEAMMDRKKKEAAERDREEMERIEKELKRKQAIEDAERKKKEDEEARIKAEEEEVARKKKEEKDRRDAELAREEAELKRKEEEIARSMKEQEAAQARAEKLRALELAEEEAAAELKSQNPQEKEEEEERKKREQEAAAAAKLQAAENEVAQQKQKEEATSENETSDQTEAPSSNETPKQLEEAAKKIQTAQRGNAARKELQRRRAESMAPGSNPSQQQQSASQQNEDDASISSEPKSATNDASASASASPSSSSKPMQEEGQEAALLSSSSSPASKNNNIQESTSENNTEGGGDTGAAAATVDDSEINDKVDAALASGEWKKVIDKSGRDYFYHPATKKTCWDLHKEIKKGCKHSKK